MSACGRDPRKYDFCRATLKSNVSTHRQGNFLFSNIFHDPLIKSAQNIKHDQDDVSVWLHIFLLGLQLMIILIWLHLPIIQLTKHKFHQNYPEPTQHV